MTDPHLSEVVVSTKAKYAVAWWEPGFDAREMAWYQLNEPVLLVDFGAFQLAVGKLLGRPVGMHEFGVSLDRLLAEAVRARAGQPTTDEEKVEAIVEGMQRLQAKMEEKK